MKQYDRYYTICPFCHKGYRGFVPKNGDGSTSIFPKHYVSVSFTMNREKMVCRGSYKEIEK